MKALPLSHVHERLGARMAEFAGWQMPLEYGSVVSEVKAVRQRAGLFDISHMGRLELSGPSAGAILQRLTTNDLDKMEDGKAQYTLFLNASGGVIDDAVVYRLSPSEYFIVVNAANLQKDLAWLGAHIEGEAELADWTDGLVLFALQGPLAEQILTKAGVEAAHSLRRFHFVETAIGTIHCAISRTGYTGENGFEIAARVEVGGDLWQKLEEAGGEDLHHCGLAARDVLRIEAGYPLYGHEIDEVTNPVEAGLMKFVKLEGTDFIGRSAVMSALSRPPARMLISLEMDGRAVPRDGDLVLADNGRIGYVSSGTFSPTLSRGIGLVFAEPNMAKQGRQVEVQIRDARRPGLLKNPPLYSPRSAYAD